MSMLGAADIESWDDDIRTDALEELARAGWDRAGAVDALSFRQRRLLARWRDGERLSTRELADLRAALLGG
ncbi:MAG: hypothetical protein OEL76_01710 [Siculibacillus sp.]|nr:hypothetical protein [Siculibacillus sp.]